MSKPASNNPFGSWKMILLLIMAGAVVLSLSPVSADKPGVTIVAAGDQSYYMGEKVVFSGINTDSDSTYLFITGPNLPDNGGKLSSPQQKPVSGDPGSFTVATTKPDNTWEYTWYTSDLRLDAGTYTIYAATKPEAKDQLTIYGTVGIVYKKPYIMAEISPASVSQGAPITVSGVAVGIPPNVQVWILGKNYYTKAIVSVNSTDTSFRYVVPGEVTSKLASGQYFAIVQHPMRYNKFDIDVSGDYVRSLQPDNGTNLFRISGPGSLQGSDAADALITAISDREAHDDTLSNDTYTLIPFQVTGPTSADTGVTIAAQGDQSYYLGENVVLSGNNYDSDTTYLFITGPDTFMNGPGIPTFGGKLTVPLQKVVNGNPDSFTTVKTKPDKSWEYVYYTHNLNVDAGTYTVYAVSQPKAKDQLNGVGSADVGIILKKPFIATAISPLPVQRGQPFTVTGYAEGNPPAVQLWILGSNFFSHITVPVDYAANYTFTTDAQFSEKLTAGDYYLIAEHPMADNRFDFTFNGEYVTAMQGNNSTILFKVTGPGSLQGWDAANALVSALSENEHRNETYARDTHAIVAFTVGEKTV